jgi:hypothetical protein
MDKHIHFTDHDHSYWYYGDNPKGERYVSVSQLFKGFQKQFDSLGHSLRMMLKDLEPAVYKTVAARGRHKKQESMLEEIKQISTDYPQVVKAASELRDSWRAKADTSTTEGTSIHLDLEMASIDRGYEINPFNGKTYRVIPSPVPGDGNRSHTEDLADMVDGYYPEMVLFHHGHKLAGQSDRVFLDTDHTGRRLAWFDDYKTDKEIDRKSFHHPVYGYQYLLPPLEHLHDCRFNVYAMKISTYAWMLKQSGYHIAGMRLTHIDKATGKITPYILPFREFEVEQMLEIYTSRR